MRELFIELIDLILSSGGGGLVAAILSLFFVLRFLRWALAASRGGSDAEEIAEQAGNYRRRLESAPGRLRDTVRGTRRRY